MANWNTSQEYMIETMKASDMLSTLKAFMDSQHDVDMKAINWGHVGSMKKVVGDLEAVMKFLGLS